MKAIKLCLFIMLSVLVLCSCGYGGVSQGTSAPTASQEGSSDEDEILGRGFISKDLVVEMKDENDKVILETHHIYEVFARHSEPNSSYYVELVLTQEGKELFVTATQENIDKPIDIVVDGKVISSPTVEMPITDGHVAVHYSQQDEMMELFDTLTQ